MKINLPIHSAELRSRPASSSRLVNCFLEALPPGSRSPVVLMRSPGVSAWTTVGTGPIRGMYQAPIETDSGQVEYLYVVSGDEFYYVDSTGAATLLGNIGTPGNIDIDSNRNAVVVVNEPRAYYWDGTTFAEILDDDFVSRGAGDVEFMDNFMLFREPNSDRFFGSEFGDATDFNSLNFGKAWSNPDYLTGMLVIHRMVINFGNSSGEIWENTGAAGFPFERNINGVFEEGCLNGKTVAQQDNAAFWVADDYTVRRLDGIVPVRVSTHAVEQFLSGCTVSTLEAFTYEQEGHFFYCLTADEGSWVYDAVTDTWGERQSYGYDNWRVRYHAQFAGKELVGDYLSNKIGYLTFDDYEEWGDTQIMEWAYQPVYAEGQRAFHKRFEVVLETGVGLTTGQGSDPLIMLQKSDDGGKTWQSLPNKKLGKLGDRMTRAVWHNLGSSRQRVYKASVSDPVAIAITDTIIEVDGGRL